MKRVGKTVLEVNQKRLRSQIQVSNNVSSSSSSCTKSEIKEEPVSTVEDCGPETKAVNLAEFKFSPKKGKLSSISKLQAVKREHIEVKYDEDSSQNKHKANKIEPENWEIILSNLREMRKNSDAPVDTMGCDQCHDESASEEDKRFQILLALMLSSQTKDQTVHAAMLKLREHGCSVTNILNTSDEKLGELIYPVSFWKTKVKNIKKTAELIRTTFNGDIPRTVEDLCKLHGVGPKMAHLCMKTAWGEITGIGVDVHVDRISNRLGWVKTKTPEQTREALENWLPRKLWSEVNHILVGFGQTICKADPQCNSCLNNKLCPFGIKQTKIKKKN